MICPRCLERWAPFPDGDFKNIVVRGGDGHETAKIVPVSRAAMERRESEFNRDEEEICSQCKEAL